jgi:hypothetical protein
MPTLRVSAEHAQVGGKPCNARRAVRPGEAEAFTLAFQDAVRVSPDEFWSDSIRDLFQYPPVESRPGFPGTDVD